MKNKIIIDTDLGTDIDDAMAIAVAMQSPELNILGITTVYGDSVYRAKLAKKLTLLNNKDIKIYPGIDLPLLKKRKIFMAGNEGVDSQAGLEQYKIENQHAVDFIIDQIKANPGEITLVTIGPLTNIACALIKEPSIANDIKEIVMMGGVTKLGSNRFQENLTTVEHNIVCDPEAASIVFNSGANILMIGLDVTLQLPITLEHGDRLLASNSPMNHLLGEMLKDWIKFVESYFNSDTTYMHDPLALVSAFNRSFIETKKMDIDVVFSDEERSGMTVATLNENSNIEVALEVKSEEFLEFLFTRVLNDK